MSLAIDVDRVDEVLLPDGEWHKVSDTSFVIDSYEYVEGAETTFKGGQAKEVIPAGARPGRARTAPSCSVRSRRSWLSVTRPGRKKTW